MAVSYSLKYSAYISLFLVFPFFHLVDYSKQIYLFNFLTWYYNQFLTQAKTICPSDPLVQNELGVSAYHVKE